MTMLKKLLQLAKQKRNTFENALVPRLISS